MVDMTGSAENDMVVRDAEFVHKSRYLFFRIDTRTVATVLS